MNTQASTSRLSTRGCYYFGTFNPVHIGHLLIARMALNQFCDLHGIRTVTFVPAGQPPHRQEDSDLLSAADRLKLVRLAIGSNPRFSVSEVELLRNGPTYTVDTLEALHPEEIAAGLKIPVVIGADAFRSIGAWHRAERLLEIAFFIQAPRPASAFSEEVSIQGTMYRADTQKLLMPEMEISATWIRQQLRAGQNLQYLLSGPVRRFIENNGLYRNQGSGVRADR